MDAADQSATSRALVLAAGAVQEVSPSEVAGYDGPGFLWLHVEGTGRDGEPELPVYLPPLATRALLARETRPRCNEVDQAALINLRGNSHEPTPRSDRLSSIRVWVEGNRVTSVSRPPLQRSTESRQPCARESFATAAIS